MKNVNIKRKICLITSICLLTFISAVALSSCDSSSNDNDSKVNIVSNDESGIIESDYKCVKSETISGIVTGNVSVSNNAVLTVSGVVSNNVNVAKNCKVICSGVITGNITGNGSVEISGVVNGSIADTLTGVIHKDAYVQGVQYTEDVILK